MSVPNVAYYPEPDDSTSTNENAIIKGSIIATWALAVIAVCLRFIARRLSKARFWYDDWLVLPATLCAAALCFTSVVWMTEQGLGHYVFDVTSRQLGPFVKGIFISEICWTFVIWIVKSSILAFYWRLFSVNRRSIQVIIWILAVVVMTWGVAVLLVTVLQCVPVYQLWNLEDSSGCHVATFAIYVGSSTPHIVTDIVLLGFPVPLIWKLHMHRSQKIMLTAIFAVGGFVTIVSMIRLVYLIKLSRALQDETRNYANIIIWTSVEVNISIICACLPSLGPIASYISEVLKRLRKRKNTHKRRSQLLMDILPEGKPASLSASPSSWRQSSNDGSHLILESPVVVDVEARNPRAPKSDAEASEPRILEI